MHRLVILWFDQGIDKILFFDLVSAEDDFARLEQIIQLSTFNLASSELLCVHGTLGQINNITEAAIFIHLIHYFAAKVIEVVIFKEFCVIVQWDENVGTPLVKISIPVKGQVNRTGTEF